MRNKRSLLNFGILIIAASAATIFILGEAEKAVAEINALSNSPVYLGVRQLAANNSQSPGTIDTSNWKIYRNEKYGFEVEYPVDWNVNDQSYTYQNQKYASIRLMAPIRHDIKGYENPGAYFTFTIYFNNSRAVLYEAVLLKVREGNEQSPVEVIKVDQKLMDSYQKIASQIISTAKIFSSAN